MLEPRGTVIVTVLPDAKNKPRHPRRDGTVVPFAPIWSRSSIPQSGLERHDGLAHLERGTASEVHDQEEGVEPTGEGLYTVEVGGQTGG